MSLLISKNRPSSNSSRAPLRPKTRRTTTKRSRKIARCFNKRAWTTKVLAEIDSSTTTSSLAIGKRKINSYNQSSNRKTRKNSRVTRATWLAVKVVARVVAHPIPQSAVWKEDPLNSEHKSWKRDLLSSAQCLGMLVIRTNQVKGNRIFGWCVRMIVALSKRILPSQIHSIKVAKILKKKRKATSIMMIEVITPWNEWVVSITCATLFNAKD